METFKLYYKLDTHKDVCEAFIEAEDIPNAIMYLYEDMYNEGLEIETVILVEKVAFDWDNPEHSRLLNK